EGAAGQHGPAPHAGARQPHPGQGLGRHAADHRPAGEGRRPTGQGGLVTELATAAQRGAFDEWVDMMREWHRELDVTPDPRVELTAKFADVPAEIAFGRYAGERRWESVGDIPDPKIKEALLRLI